MRCDLCGAPAQDTLGFETGNNAEHAIAVALCNAHMAEYEETGYDFETKYADRILECLYENWRGRADGMEK